MRYPAPLRPGDRIGVTAPSAGVDDGLRARLDVAIRTVEARGYEVVVGSCMDGAGHVSAPAAERARELMDLLTDPTVKAVVPPWGGQTAIDLLPLLDWDALRAAEPTWVVGFSDMSTIITPLTLLTGVATVHGNNLMDTPYRAPEGLLTWLDIVTMAPGTTFTQVPPNRHRAQGWDDYRTAPEVNEFTLDAPGTAGLTQHEAVLDALGGLGVPIVADVECGHVPPYLPIVNGARGRLVCTADRNELTQTLG
ncbi:LD-carboxypeptidase [Nonomuraea sp. NPDC049709]|uniref:LD-carboxypeptidase n=1 Tax=Nonomuraea sp. NPDC049709 TaxID=3154736 RepID=UPI003419E1E8